MIESPVLDEVKEIIHQRGMTDASRQFILDNLELRFGPVPLPVSAKLAEMRDATRLRELRELFRVSVTCPTLEAFETALQSK